MSLHLTLEAWDAWLDRLYERGERLDLRQPGASYPRDEWVDEYVLSAHAEALRSESLDGGLWEAVEDLDLQDEVPAGDDEAAWAAVKGFYLERGGVLVQLEGGDEWILDGTLLERLGLPGQDGGAG